MKTNGKTYEQLNREFYAAMDAILRAEENNDDAAWKAACNRASVANQAMKAMGC